MRSRVTVLYTLRLLPVWKWDYAERAIEASPLLRTRACNINHGAIIVIK